MDYKEIKMSEAVALAATDAELKIYMLTPITKDTTIEMLSKAGGFVLATKEEKPEPDKSPEPEKKKLGRVDHAKIVMLYNEDPTRPLQGIANDVGCSVQSVINHLDKEGIYQKRGEASGDTED